MCQQVAPVDGVPDWIPLVPAGAKIQALDGRKFGNPDPQSVVDAFNADPRDIAVDWEHASEIRAPEGKDAPAAGWITAMEVRDGAIWGKVEWTPRGVESLKSREYRYISPAFLFDRDSGQVREIVSAALVNRPALDMPAVARANRVEKQTQEEDTMDREKLIKLLGLAADATDDDIISAIEKRGDEPQAKLDEVKTELETTRAKLEETETALTNARKANPSLDKFVPRADFDAAIARASDAEEKLEAQAKEAHDAEVKAAIDAAVKDGKIVPANRDYYAAQCATAEGLVMFREFVERQPVIGDVSDLDHREKPATDGNAKALTEEEKAICAQAGVSEEAFLAAKNAVD